MTVEATFKLSKPFVARYKEMRAPFGFGGLGELVFLRTYSRITPNGKNEEWFETVERVVTGCYRMQERHIKQHNLGWDPRKAQKSAQEMFDRMFHMKFLPPGRGLWAMGTELTESRGLFAALNNCGFTSTEHIDEEGAEPFAWLMDASMLGIGVGFDNRGAGKVVVHAPAAHTCYPHRIEDSREGWVDSVRCLINAYLRAGTPPGFDYSLIRAAGEPIRGFGGVASGPEPLWNLHDDLTRVLEKNVGSPITVRTIVDICNLIGRCVVAGNVRRTALITFGEADDEEYLGLKNYWWDAEKGGWEGPAAERADWGWTSNNSVFATVGQDYTRCAAQTAVNGEPGYLWLENSQQYGRTGDAPNGVDHRVRGANPCGEQPLEHMELCCLVECFINNHESQEDFRRTLKFAYLYAKTVTLGQTHWPLTNRVMLRNRRIGASLAGIQQFIARHDLHTFKEWCEDGYQTIGRYDRVYSDWFAIPQSIKKTSVKPGGTVPLLAGATPGEHWPHALHYLRRIRLSVNSELIAPLAAAGYSIEPCVGQEDSTVVVAVPVKLDSYGGKLRTVAEVPMWEQVTMAAFMQRYWADNQVSCLTEETMVRTTQGLIRMEQLPGLLQLNANLTGAQPYTGPMKILDGNGEWQSISALIINPPAPLVKVIAEGGQELTGTPDHRIQVLGENLELVWKRLCEINAGDYMVERLNQSSYPSTTQLLSRRMDRFDRKAGTSGNKEVTVPRVMTADLAEFLGYMVSDGHALRKGAGFGLTQQDNNVVPRFKELARSLFGIEVKVVPDSRCEGLLQIKASSVVVREWFDFIGLYDSTGMKRVPWPILASGHMAIKAFLRGITLDGHVSKGNGRITVMTTNSYSLAEEIVQLSKIVGFQPSLFRSSAAGERTFPGGSTYKTKPSWGVSLSPEQSARFARMVGFAEERKEEEYRQFGQKTRRSLFGGVPDRGLRLAMAEVARRCSSHFLTDHFHSASLHLGKEVSRESLLQLRDMGIELPTHLSSSEYAFRRVIQAEAAPAATTYDLTVEGSHTYLANGFVSHNCTVSFDPVTEGPAIAHALDYLQYDMKGISFLPVSREAGEAKFPQMPYETISEAEYEALAARLKPLDFSAMGGEESEQERFCDSQGCLL